MAEYNWSCSFAHGASLNTISISVIGYTSVEDTSNTDPEAMAEGVSGPVRVTYFYDLDPDDTTVRSYKTLQVLNLSILRNMGHYDQCQQLVFVPAEAEAEQGENERFNTQVISAYRALIKELTPNYVVLNNIISGQNEAGEEVWLVDENDVRIESDLLEN